MKKNTLMMLCILFWSVFSVYSATTSLYLVANDGTTWTSMPSGFTNVYKVNLSTCNASAAATLTQFLTDRTLATPTYTVSVVTGSGNPVLASGDQIWVAAGTYNVSTVYTYNANLNIYGGFKGDETATTSRPKGSNTWNFTYETIINGSGSTTGIFTATADRVGATIDGMTFTACSTVAAVWARAATVRYCKFTTNTYNALNFQANTLANTATCTDCYFYNNSAPIGSGAACISVNTTGTSNITNCTFDTNSNASTTSASSAGIKTQGTGATNISNCIFKGNSASAGNSSAVSFNTATGSISNCLIYGNTGKQAIYMNGGNVYNCTVVNNTAGGAYLSPSTNSPVCNIYNSVFWGTDANSGTVSFANASTTGDFKYNATSSATPTGAGLSVSGNIVLPQNNTTGTNAPNFSNPASNDWSLTSTSSLIDIGNGSISGVPTIDYANVSRPMGGAYDIGAYEFTISQEKSSNGGFEAALGTYTVVESSANVLYRVANTFDASTTTGAPTATSIPVTTGLWVKKSPSVSAVKATVITTDKHSGINCLNLKIPSGVTTTGFNTWPKLLVQQKTSLQNTIKYTVSFWAKVDATTPNVAGNANMVGVFIADNVIKSGSLPLSGTVTLTTSWAQYSVTLDIPAYVTANPTADFSTAYVGIGLQTTYDAQATPATYYSGILFDDFSVAPVLGSTTVSPTSLTGFNYAYAVGPSSEQSFTIGGSGLGSNLQVSPTADYEVSTTSGTGYQSTAISLTPTAGAVSNTTIYTRLKSGLNAGSYNSENINVGIMGVTNTPKTVACSGTVSKATPTLTITGTTSFTYTGLPQGPATVTTVGSTGTVTYSYVSTDGTTYPASATKPTNAGSYTVTATAAADANYNQASSSATAFSIAQAPLTITGISIANKVYDGTNAASISGTAAYSGLVNNENPAIAGTATAAFADATVGNGKSVTVLGYTAPSANYSITQPSGFTANIYPVTSTFSKSGSSNWSTATEWTYSPMAATDLVISSGELVVDQTAAVHSITVAPGAKLSLSSGTLTAGTLTLQSDATGTATFVHSGGTLAATTTNVQQYLTAGRNWYISSPVSNATSAVFNPGGSLNGGTGTTKLYWYDEVNASTLPWPQITTNSTTLDPMKGYVVNLAHDSTIVFSGTLNIDAPTINVSRTVGQTGFNLVGNPFTAYLDWDQVSAAATNIGTSIWQRSKNHIENPDTHVITSNYVFDTYNASGKILLNNSGKGINSHIPPMQAFWVRVNDGVSTGSLTLSANMRSHKGTQTTGTDINSNPIIVNDPIFKSKATVSQSVLRLQVSNGTSTDETVLYSNSNALNSYDNYDSPKMFNNSASTAEIYTLAGTEQLAINGLNSIPFDTEIPLGFTTGTAGTFSLKASQFSNFAIGTQVILKDYANLGDPAIADLSDGGSYSFTSDATSNNTTRFSLLFYAPSVTTAGINPIDNNAVWILTNGEGKIMINGAGAGKTLIEVYNSLGQQVMSKQLNATGGELYAKFAPGVYMLRVMNAAFKMTKKFIVD